MRGLRAQAGFRLPAVAVVSGMTLVLLMGSSASAVSVGSRVVGSGAQRTTTAQRAATRAYWTPQRLAAAKPYPMPKGIGNPGVGAAAGPTGKAGAIVGRAPSTTRTASNGATPIRQAVGTGGRITPQTTNYPYPFPFTRYFVDTVLYPSHYPYTTIGKLFFSQLDPSTGRVGNYVCSASSVPTSSAASKVHRPVLWTAGHCVSNGAGTFSTKVIFIPDYENGAQPYGQFVCGQLWTTTAWHSTHDFTRDMGACAIGNNQFGKTLPSTVGTLGFAWNQSRQQHWSEFGYPQAAPFNGQWMVVCESSHATDDTSVPGVGADPQGVGCDMTGGSSGGPWVIGWKNQTGPNPLPGGGFVNGHNDYKYGTQPLAMYSPYFDSIANQVRCGAATGSGTATC
jgi:hypothetical protein